MVGKYLNKNSVLANNEYKNFIAWAVKENQRVDAIIKTPENPEGIFNQEGYDFWVLQNAQMIAAYMADDALRPMFRIKYGATATSPGGFLAYFDKLDEEIAANADSGG